MFRIMMAEPSCGLSLGCMVRYTLKLLILKYNFPSVSETIMACIFTIIRNVWLVVYVNIPNCHSECDNQYVCFIGKNYQTSSIVLIDLWNLSSWFWVPICHSPVFLLSYVSVGRVCMQSVWLGGRRSKIPLTHVVWLYRSTAVICYILDNLAHFTCSSFI